MMKPDFERINCAAPVVLPILFALWLADTRRYIEKNVRGLNGGAE
jgi:hypothetical protein